MGAFTRFAAVLVIVFAFGSASGADLEASVEADFFSAYVWRGLLLTDDPVFQPSASAGYRGLSLEVWGNMDLTDTNGRGGTFSECDCTLGYERAVSLLTLEGGVIHYSYPNTGVPGTTELFAGVGFDVPLQPALRANVDVDECDGTYLCLTIGHEQPLIERVGLNGFASVGYGDAKHNDFNYGCRETAFSDAAVGAALATEVSEHFSIETSVTYTTQLDSGIRDLAGDGDNIFYGAAFSYSF